MKPHWLELTKKLEIDDEVAEIAWQEIAANHDQPHRTYHNLTHLRDMFKHLENMATEIPHQVSLAVWFHDIVYDPKSQTNEPDSAQRMRELLQGHVSDSILKRTGELILLTRAHQIEDETKDDAALLLDADLSILGSNRPEYETYSISIRQEYRHIPNEHYRTGRTAVLRHFLSMPQIYLTAYGLYNWEDLARENLRWEWDVLKAN